MNRNLLKWILIAAVIIGAAGYLILSGTSTNHKKERIEVEGHSKAFKVEPIEGITISAEENALDKNRKFKLTAVDDKVYDKVVEQLDGSDVRPLMVFELDAGLKPEDRLPGDYEVTMDLDGMGIPRCLHDNVAILRGVGSDKKLAFSEYNTRVKDGKLTFRSNRNSKLILGLRHRPEFVLTSGYHMFYKSPITYFQEACASWWSGAIETIHMYFYDPTYTTILVEHESGNFRLHFLFRDTEGNGRYLAYRANNWAFENRINELEKEAHRLWEAKVQKQVEKELGEYKEFCFFKWAFSKKQVDAIKAGINEEAILDSLVSIDVKNGELARIQADPNGKLPESIETIINQIIRANQYLDTISLHKLDFFIDVFLVDDWAIKADGLAKTYFFYDGYMFLNYPNYFKPGPDKTQVTFVHELGHLRQQGYYGMKASSEAQEATIVVLERDAARQWHKDGFFKADPESRTTVSDLMTPRSTYQMFGIPLDKTNCPDEGYTMGDAIEGIREGVGKEWMDMSYFIYSFIGHGPHKNGWTGWIKWALDIDDEQLNKGWHHFGATRLYYIFDCLTHSDGQSPTAKEAATVHLDLTPSSPVAHLKKLRKPRDYAVSTFWIHLPNKPKDVTEEAANVFVYCEDPGTDPYVSFYWSDWEFREYLKNKDQNVYLLKPEPSLFYAGNRETDYVKDENGNIKIRLQDGKRRTNYKSGGYQLAAVTSSQSKGPWHNYYVVALFKPEPQKITKVKEDVITFRVPKPDKDLRKKGLVSGAEYTYTDKNGHTETFIAGPDLFGKKVKWPVADCCKSGNEFSISFHWFYELDENTTCVSPESDKTEFNVGEKKTKNVKKEEPVKNDEKKGYWKQVRANCIVKEKSIDEDELRDDLATHDVRGIGMKRTNGEKEIEFTGIASMKVKEKGKTLWQPETCLDGYVSFTEPPLQWPANTNYTCEWYIEKDPFVMKMDKPFTFKVENTTSAPKACSKGKDKVTEKKSKTARAKWLNQEKTVFKTNKPKKDDPRAFTITQQFTISDGADLKAYATLTYEYEWVEGEMESANLEKEITSKDEPKAEPAQESQEKYLDVYMIDFASKTLEPYGGQIGWTSFDSDGIHYYNIQDITSTRSGAYQVVTMKIHQNTFNDDPQGYQFKESKLDQDFTLTIKIAKDKTVEGSFHITRKSHAGAGQPAHPSTCNMTMSGTFGPLKADCYGKKYVVYQAPLPSFSYSVGGFLAYYWDTNDIRDFSYSTSSTNAEVKLTLYVK